MTREDLDTLREGIDFEAKLAAGPDGRGELPRSFWETCSAFANTQGGRIVLGLKELEEGFDIRGLPDPQKVETDLWSTLNNRQKISAQVIGPRDIQRAEIEGRTLLIIDIPRAPRELRPVYLGGNPFTGTCASAKATATSSPPATTPSTRSWPATSCTSSRVLAPGPSTSPPAAKAPPAPACCSSAPKTPSSTSTRTSSSTTARSAMIPTPAGSTG